MKNTFKILLAFCILMTSMSSCKKDSTPGNFLKLNEDKRNLDPMPSTKAMVSNDFWSTPGQDQLSIKIKSDCFKIAGLNNDTVDVWIIIYDDYLTKAEYDLTPGYLNGSGPSGKATLGIRPHENGGTGALTLFDGQSGKIRIKKDEYGFLTSVEFQNIPLNAYNGKSFTTSGRFTL